MRTRTARLILSSYLAFLVYMDLAYYLASSGVASLPLNITDISLSGEVSITTHTIGLVLIIFLFLILRRQQANPVRA